MAEASTRNCYPTPIGENPMTNLSRRNFLSGIVAAPAVVAASSIMPVKLWTPMPFLNDYNMTVWYKGRENIITGEQVWKFHRPFGEFEGWTREEMNARYGG